MTLAHKVRARWIAFKPKWRGLWLGHFFMSQQKIGGKPMQEDIQALQTIINNSQHLVFFGGQAYQPNRVSLIFAVPKAFIVKI